MSVDLLLPCNLFALALLSGLLVDLLQLVLLKDKSKQKRNRSEGATGAPSQGKYRDQRGKNKRKKRAVRTDRPAAHPAAWARD